MGEGGEQEFRLSHGRSLVLHESGLLHPAGATLRFTPWLEILHVTLDARALRIGAVRGCWRIPRASFLEPGAAAAAAFALRARVGALPDGPQRLERQQALDERLRSAGRPWLGVLLTALAVVLFVASRWLPALTVEGEYWGEFGLRGEPWRLVTAQLLHGGLSHLLLNGIALVALTGLLERQLGRSRTVLVLAGSGAGAMVGCAVAAYDRVVGASGLVAGVAGALLVLELFRPDLLPTLWRLPRRLLVAAIVGDGVLLLYVPNVAHAAHLGGFLAGGAVALAVAPASPARLTAGPLLRVGTVLVLGVLLASLGALAEGVVDPDRAATRRAERLLADDGTSALLLNNYAWTLAISEQPSAHQLKLALRLARRAVRETRRRDPNLLDTLAEVYFQSGRVDDALDTIDEAIALAPDQAYFREQRRRFRGERAADDRPEPPQALPEPGPELLPPPSDESNDSFTPGVRV